ncbi:WD40 repeat-like protein [Basidiobolus meristosporus CBS 931.73]|uniref:WD40 repeat-like protein n=1 Tax=Basidiobolus meristosporus CBS 931.73 TaxID=1314790 RepID=A0A1Y1XWS2_9FUNG|nr:WD40 repeat-like protein [Basidiobolus meristosporus CBS 931.73]|eukprot:ORX89794.1 WD40 repeat-like protein [Basidiobolus meristosporus CBS 931.73]
MVVQSEKITYLEVKLFEAKGLAPMDEDTGSSDPYVIITVGQGKNGQRVQSKIIHANLNPVWNSTFKLFLTEGDSKVKFTLLDHDFLSSDDPLGEVEYDFSELTLETPIRKWVPISESEEGKLHFGLRLVEGDKKNATLSDGLSNTAANRPWTGAIYPPSQFVPLADSLPRESLQLDHVYGYRTRDCRNNIHTLAGHDGSPRLAYFAGSVGIIYDPSTNTQRFFTGHNDDVISIAVHPSGAYIATGDVASVIDPEGGVKVHVWKADEPEQPPVATLKCGPGTVYKGVVAIAFSPDGKFLVAVCKDKDHTIEVFDWESSAEPFVSTSGHSDLVLDILFNPFNRTEFVIFGVKHLKFWYLDDKTRTLSSKRGIFGPKGKIQTILSAAYIDKGTLITGCMDGDIYSWDITKRQVINVKSKAHKGAIFVLSAGETSGVFYSSGKDGRIIKHQVSDQSSQIVWEGVKKSVRALTRYTEKTLVVGTEDSAIYQIELTKPASVEPISMAHDSFRMQELWGLAVHPDAPEFFTCSDDQVVARWDMSKKRMIRKVNLGTSLRSISVHPDATQIAVTAVTDQVFILDSQELTKLHEIKPRNPGTLDNWQHVVKYSPNGEFLAIGAFSMDNGIDVYLTKNWKLLGTCQGHSSRVIRMDWSSDSQYLQSNSIDSELLFWKLPSCEQEKHPSKLSDVEWSTFECPIGWPTIGIQESWMNGRDIYAVSRNPRGNLLVSANTRSQVNLHVYPAYKANTPGKIYKGHSSFVTNVSFSCNGEHVLSIGGMDGSILQWKVIE